MTAPRHPRVSLTKLQRETAAGIELIAICRQVTEDGRLSASEVEDLKGWVERYPDIQFGGHALLKSVLKRVFADGVVTPEELRDVYSAIEKVLPPDLRADVVARRRGEAASARTRNNPLDGWDFMVAGCRYEGRPALIDEHCRVGDAVFLIREPGNPVSRFAVEVRLANGYQMGYVPEADARELAPLLEAGHPYRAAVKKILTGGRSPIPVIVADVFAVDATLEGLYRSYDAPPRAWPPTVGQPPFSPAPVPSAPSSQASRASGCAVAVGFIFAGSGALVWQLFA